MKCNNSALFGKINEFYFNNVVPYEILKTSIDNGYYLISFSLYPEDKQPSGHLNFNLLEESVLILNNDEEIVNQPCELNIITKEYNILRILSGIGTLAWKN